MENTKYVQTETESERKKKTRENLEPAERNKEQCQNCEYFMVIKIQHRH